MPKISKRKNIILYSKERPNTKLLSTLKHGRGIFLLETTNGQVGSIYKFPTNQYLSSMNVQAHSVLYILGQRKNSILHYKKAFFFLSSYLRKLQA